LSLASVQCGKGLDNAVKLPKPESPHQRLGHVAFENIKSLFCPLPNDRDVALPDWDLIVRKAHRFRGRPRVSAGKKAMHYIVHKIGYWGREKGGESQSLATVLRRFEEHSDYLTWNMDHATFDSRFENIGPLRLLLV
jgi:hypothetical protein